MSLPKLSLDPDLLKPRPAPLVKAAPVTVLKFGSSILRSDADVPDVVTEIYRWVRQGHRVVAVVSALSGHTDQLLAQARRLGNPNDNSWLPRYVALGEEKSASLVAIGCDRVGLDCAALGVRELAIMADGSPEDASPVRLGSNGLVEALEQHEVVVVPGFGAVSDKGKVVLLGRGGSDLTAVFLAQALGLDRVRLVKDVDGVYDGDPAAVRADGSGPRRYSALHWKTAAEVGGKLVQRRAVEVAEAAGVEIEVAALGRDFASVIGVLDLPPAPVAPVRRRRVAVAGCGVVGGGVLARLLHNPERYEIVGVLVRDPSKARDVDLPAELLTSDPDRLFQARPDVLIEALSEGPAAEQLIRRALAAGVDVVSANKQAIALDLPGLRSLAADHARQLAYSAAVGGGAPMLETVRQARAAGEVASVEALLNGTCNFILDRLALGMAFDDALAEARTAGFAEEDPSSDLEGHDAAAKVRLLAFEAFDAVLPDAAVSRERLSGDQQRSQEAWATLKQIGRVALGPGGQVQGDVSLAVAYDPVLAAPKGERAALKAVLKDGRVFVCRGRGAGRWPTAESVLADLGDVDRLAEKA